MAKNWLKYKLSQENYDPVSVKDVLTNKREISHNEAYEYAKWQAILHSTDDDGKPLFMDDYDENECYDDDTIFVSENLETCDKEHAKFCIIPGKWKFVECESFDYKYAPVMKCTRKIMFNESKSPTMQKHMISLAPWWNMLYMSESEAKYDELVTNKIADKYPYDEIIAFDYVNEKATVENRVEMDKRKIPFKFIRPSSKININYKDTY